MFITLGSWLSKVKRNLKQGLKESEKGIGEENCTSQVRSMGSTWFSLDNQHLAKNVLMTAQRNFRLGNCLYRYDYWLENINIRNVC